VQCDSCGAAVEVALRPRTALESVWGKFDCPHCTRPNFQRLPGEVLSAA
jgi:hypothetical protein